MSKSVDELKIEFEKATQILSDNLDNHLITSRQYDNAQYIISKAYPVETRLVNTDAGELDEDSNPNEIGGIPMMDLLFDAVANKVVFIRDYRKAINECRSADPDQVSYLSFSVDTEEYNGVVTNRLYSSYYNKERFWFADPQYFLATLSVADQGKLFSLTNLGKSPMSVIVRKSTDSTAPLLGYNIFAIDWYGANNVPSFMHPYDYMSDYFVDVIAVYGNWTNYTSLSLDPLWSTYFTNNGFIKSRIDSFLANPWQAPNSPYIAQIRLIFIRYRMNLILVLHVPKIVPSQLGN